MTLYAQEAELEAPGMGNLNCTHVGMKNQLGIAVYDSKLMDFITLCFRYSAYPPKSVAVLLLHPLFTNDTLTVDSDQFGKRYCQITN